MGIHRLRRSHRKEERTGIQPSAGFTGCCRHEPQQGKARSYAERHGIPKWYTDPQELVDDPDVNAIYIATPPSTHATFAIMAMKADKPVYVEKPLASNYEDCARVNRIAEKRASRASWPTTVATFLIS